MPASSDYGDRHSHVRIWEEIDRATQRVIAYPTHREWQAQERTLYRDGRAHPPDYAAHTWHGFSTANWEGPMLSVTTTHLKMGYIRPNGVARSDRARVNEHFIRELSHHRQHRHGPGLPDRAIHPKLRLSAGRDPRHPAAPVRRGVEVERPRGAGRITCRGPTRF